MGKLANEQIMAVITSSEGLVSNYLPEYWVSSFKVICVPVVWCSSFIPSKHR